MISFYNAICKDFNIDCSTVDSYTAAYLYQCRRHSEVLQLCERIIDEPCLRSDLKELGFANAVLLLPLDSLFDRDMQSLLGLHTLVYYLSPTNSRNIEGSEVLNSHQCLARYIYSNKRALLRVVLKTYSMKGHYFLGRYFLQDI